MDEKNLSTIGDNYEITFLTDEEGSADPILELLEKVQAKVTNQVDLGVKRLAYTIQKRDSARFFCITFAAERKAIDEIEKQIRHDNNIIRYLIVKAIRKAPAKVQIKPVEPTVEEVAPATAETEVKAETIEKPKVKKVVKNEEKKEEKVVKAKAEKKPAEKKATKPAKKKEVEIEKEALDKKLEELIEE